jgi:UDP-2,3-diacylglucosamine pyrophosphatase LpxH
MKVFISDLHLGDGLRTDDFHRDKQFLKFLDFVEVEAKELIILGDLFELWQADLDRVLFQHSAVVNKLLSLAGKLKLTYVIGNHDYIPFIKFTKAGLGLSLEYSDSRSKIVAEHGYKYDIFNRYDNPLKSLKWPPGKYLAATLASLERIIHPDIDQWTRKAINNVDEFLQKVVQIVNKIPPSTEEYLQRGGHFGEFEEAVKKHITKGAKIVIFGHTHKPQLQVLGKGIYANCGAWTDGQKPTYIACFKDKIELREAFRHKIIKQLKH